MNSSTNPSSPVKRSFSGLLIPVGIVLLAGVIIFALGKILSVDRGHRDLVQEMREKSFGNRWVAAWELAKLISSSRIPDEEIPWLADNLQEIFNHSSDLRTKKFIVVALGALGAKEGLPVIEKALDMEDKEMRFNGIVALSKIHPGPDFDWNKVEKFLEEDDSELKQGVVFLLATHRIERGREKIKKLLSSPVRPLRYSAAMALINYKDEMAVPVLQELLESSAGTTKLDEYQIRQLKLNVLSLLQKENWSVMNNILEHLRDDDDAKVAVKAGMVLNVLKKR